MKTNIKLEYLLKNFLFLFVAFGLVFFLKSCKKDDKDNGKTTITEQTINLTTLQEIPPVKNRTETATASLKLFSDSTLEYNLQVSNLAQNDSLTIAHIHAGSPVESGGPIVTLVDNLTKKFGGTSASGTVKLTKSQYEKIKSNDTNLYVNIHSRSYPLGLVRGQFAVKFNFAANVDLVGLNLRAETGLAILRLSDSTLYYKISVQNLETTDKLVNASINVGAEGVTGPMIIPLIASENEFNTEKKMKLNASQISFLTTSEVYILITSDEQPSGLLRGQVR